MEYAIKEEVCVCVWLQMQADRSLDGGDAVLAVEQLLNQFAQRQRDAIKTYEAWRVRQQLRSNNSVHRDHLKQHAAEVSIHLFATGVLVLVI